jgi:hypothetical protein
MPAGSTNPTCTDCHNTAYFDSHVHGTGTNHTVSYDGGIDQVASGSGCGDCHTPISTWSDITTLHDYNGCATCHSYNGGNGEHNNTPSGTVASVILASDATTCADCHTNKAGQSHGYYDHTTNPAGGLDYEPITVDTDCTTSCHTYTDVVVDIHNDTCTVCHTASIPDLKTTPNLAQFAGTTTACTHCHQTSNDAGFTKPFHGISPSRSMA